MKIIALLLELICYKKMVHECNETRFLTWLNFFLKKLTFSDKKI